MFVSRLRTAALGAAAALTLTACSYDSYGYGGLSLGYGGYGGYYDDYYDPYYYGYSPSYYGWWGGYYYPGTGFYIYDRWGKRHRWSDRHRRYWEGRRHNRDGRWDGQSNWSGYRSGDRSPNWQGSRPSVRQAPSGTTTVRSRPTRTERGNGYSRTREDRAAIRQQRIDSRRNRR